MTELSGDDLARARRFVEAMPFRHVRDATHGNPESKMDPHEYIIGSWERVPWDDFWWFVGAIEQHGHWGRYQARYSDRGYVRKYLDIGDRVYWFIKPFQLCRTKIEYRQHERLDGPVPAQSRSENPQLRLELEP